MDWTYRIVDHGEHFALHEVFVDEAGTPHDWVSRSIDFACDRELGPEGIIASLERALEATRDVPPLVLNHGHLEQG